MIGSHRKGKNVLMKVKKILATGMKKIIVHFPAPKYQNLSSFINNIRIETTFFTFESRLDKIVVIVYNKFTDNLTFC